MTKEQHVRQEDRMESAYYDDCKVKIEGEMSLPEGLKLPGVYRCLHQSNQSGIIRLDGITE